MLRNTTINYHTLRRWLKAHGLLHIETILPQIPRKKYIMHDTLPIKALPGEDPHNYMQRE